MEKLTTGQLAKNAGVNIETIRFYERRGLLDKPPRNQSGHRQYGGADVMRTKFIKRAQSLGFSLKEIEELLKIKIEPGVTCGDIKKRIDAKKLNVEQKINDLSHMRSALNSLSRQCMGNGPVGTCPFLKALEAQDSMELNKWKI